MAEYAHVVNGQITRFIDIDLGIHDAWVEAKNPKALVYLPVVTETIPQYSQNTHVLEETYTVQSSQVIRNWLVRPKTEEELVQIWTAYQFLNRFTDAELMDIRSRTSTDPVMWKFLTFATAAQEIVSNDPVTVAGMGYLVLVGVLTEERKNEILGLLP